jgi:hypothetical protein
LADWNKQSARFRSFMWVIRLSGSNQRQQRVVFGLWNQPEQSYEAVLFYCSGASGTHFSAG